MIRARSSKPVKPLDSIMIKIPKFDEEFISRYKVTDNVEISKSSLLFYIGALYINMYFCFSTTKGTVDGNKAG